MTLITQAEFARLKSVSKAAVSQWKKEGRIKMVGKLIDLEETETIMVPGSSFRSKRRVPARHDGVKLPTEIVNRAPKLNSQPLASYPVSMSVMITGCAADLAIILLRAGLPRAQVQVIADEWFTTARCSALGLLENDLAPPAGFERWADHPGFRDPWLTDWAELEYEATLPPGTGSGV